MCLMWTEMILTFYQKNRKQITYRMLIVTEDHPQITNTQESPPNTNSIITSPRKQSKTSLLLQVSQIYYIPHLHYT